MEPFVATYFFRHIITPELFTPIWLTIDLTKINFFRISITPSQFVLFLKMLIHSSMTEQDKPWKDFPPGNPQTYINCFTSQLKMNGFLMKTYFFYKYFWKLFGLHIPFLIVSVVRAISYHLCFNNRVYFIKPVISELG